jgi:hypothetical protein
MQSLPLLLSVPHSLAVLLWKPEMDGGTSDRIQREELCISTHGVVMEVSVQLIYDVNQVFHQLIK